MKPRMSVTGLIAALIVGMTVCATSLHADDAAATAPSTRPEKTGATKFYGAITAVDPKAMTFVVDGQTYNVTPETQMTNAADDKSATLADATVGEPARGSYTKTDDGKMNVTKVRFGRKAGGGGKNGGKKKTAATQPADQ